MPTAISLFSGAMGLDLGLERAGITTKLAVEIDRHCCRTIEQNRPAVDVWETDIQQVNAKSLLKKLSNPTDVFLMVGGTVPATLPFRHTLVEVHQCQHDGRGGGVIGQVEVYVARGFASVEQSLGRVGRRGEVGALLGVEPDQDLRWLQ